MEYRILNYFGELYIFNCENTYKINHIFNGKIFSDKEFIYFNYNDKELKFDNINDLYEYIMKNISKFEKVKDFIPPEDNIIIAEDYIIFKFKNYKKLKECYYENLDLKEEIIFFEGIFDIDDDEYFTIQYEDEYMEEYVFKMNGEYYVRDYFPFRMTPEKACRIYFDSETYHTSIGKINSFLQLKLYIEENTFPCK